MSFLTNPEGVRLRYTDRGEGVHTIVLVHGWKGSHRMWDPAVYRLMRGFRVIAFDNRGMGESDKPAGPYDFGVLAADLEFVLETLRADNVTLVGWSMGCTISLEYLSRGGGRVGRLVLMNGPLKLTRTPEFPWTMTEEQLPATSTTSGRAGPTPRRPSSRGALLDPKSAYADLYYQVALQTPLEMAMRIVDEQVRMNHIPVLPTLQMPVLAAYGRHDPYYPIALAEFIAKTAPRGSYVVFEESAHAPHYEEPDRFCEVSGLRARMT